MPSLHKNGGATNGEAFGRCIAGFSVLGFVVAPVSAGASEVVQLDRAKLAIENVKSMSVSVGGGYAGVTVTVSTTFNDNMGSHLVLP
ncbi:hypothetical protein [Thermococcus piezophilus]|uniref:hypothetical protein n=1 Tax=Thermococcus piezophilus TaxID=1712654 RepID=UPI00190235CA|nr:hypothetical protein [Thermococcus piezophilus]